MRTVLITLAVFCLAVAAMSQTLDMAPYVEVSGVSTSTTAKTADTAIPVYGNLRAIHIWKSATNDCDITIATLTNVVGIAAKTLLVVTDQNASKSFYPVVPADTNGLAVTWFKEFPLVGDTIRASVSRAEGITSLVVRVWYVVEK